MKQLLGKAVVRVDGHKCEGCMIGNGKCMKVELVGGKYICLASHDGDLQKAVKTIETGEKNLKTITAKCKKLKQENKALKEQSRKHSEEMVRLREYVKNLEKEEHELRHNALKFGFEVEKHLEKESAKKPWWKRIFGCR